MSAKKLYRSRTDRWIGGVCGGIGEYFDIDPLLIRLAFIVALLIWGAGILIYLIMWIVVPIQKENWEQNIVTSILI